ncbi:MAG: AI-2E family transporter [Firmicutes bacterium]|nr:AI-2E family transporter [Bacillota bacterium]
MEDKNFQLKVKIITKYIFLLIMSILLITFAMYQYPKLKNIIEGLNSILAPIYYGIAIAYLLDPLAKSYRKRLSPMLKKYRKGETVAKGLSITFSMITGVVIVVALIWLIIPSLVDSITIIVEEMPAQVESFVAWLEKHTTGDSVIMKNLSMLVTRASGAVEDWLRTDLIDTVGDVVTAITTGVIDVVMFVFNLLIGVVVAVYVMVDKEKFIGQSKKLVYTIFKRETGDSILDTARHGHKIFGGFLYGKILDSAIVGVITFIVLAILRTPYSLLVSVIVGVTNIIPFFGPFIGGIPCAILILLADPLQGLYFIIFIIIMQQIDGNIIGPKILGNTTGISEFWVTFALLLFGGIFGFLGMIVGVPAFAVVYYAVVQFMNKKLIKKGLPVESYLYRDSDNIQELLDKQKKIAAEEEE